MPHWQVRFVDRQGLVPGRDIKVVTLTVHRDGEQVGGPVDVYLSGPAFHGMDNPPPAVGAERVYRAMAAWGAAWLEEHRRERELSDGTMQVEAIEQRVRSLARGGEKLLELTPDAVMREFTGD